MRRALEILAGVALAWVLGFVLVMLAGCPASRTAGDLPRDVARGGVLLVVQAAEQAGTLCRNVQVRAAASSDVAFLLKVRKAGVRCAHGRDAALHAARAMHLAIDASKAGATGELGCLAVTALGALAEVRDALEDVGEAWPAAFEDALETARRLADLAPRGASCPIGGTS